MTRSEDEAIEIAAAGIYPANTLSMTVCGQPLICAPSGSIVFCSCGNDNVLRKKIEEEFSRIIKHRPDCFFVLMPECISVVQILNIDQLKMLRDKFNDVIESREHLVESGSENRSSPVS